MQHVTTLAHKAGFKPGKTVAEYEKPKLHHIGRMPTFEKHVRVIRELGPVVPGAKRNYKLRQEGWGAPIKRPINGQRRFVVSRKVEKVIMSTDGRTPRSPIHVLQKDPQTGKQEHVLQTTLFPVQCQVLLKRGTPKMMYRHLKRHNATLRTPHLYKGR